MNGAEATFYNGVDKNILHAVLAEMSKHARRKFKDVLGENGKAKLAIEYCDQIFKIERALKGYPLRNAMSNVSYRSSQWLKLFMIF